MTAKVFCIASAKGGSGKTIITANIASLLTDVGKKCLIIDCDIATFGMTLLYIVEISSQVNENKIGLFDYFEYADETGNFGDNLVSVQNGVDLLPATYTFRVGDDPEYRFDSNILENIVNAMRSKYDLIFLDAQAGSDKYSRLAMSKKISDEVILVSEYDPLSSAGIDRLKQVIGEGLGYERTWVLLNKMLPEFVEKFSEFLSVTKFLPPIPWNANVVRAYAKRKLALDLDRGNEFTLAIMRTVSALVDEDLENEIKSWANKRAYALREPLENQYAAIELELETTLKNKNQFERKRTRNLLAKAYLIILSVPIALFSVQNSRFVDAIEIISTETFGVEFLLVFYGVLILFLIPMFLGILSKFLNRGKTAESVRYDRIIATLEEKLRQLETLRSADFETMVKRSDSSST